MTQNWSGAQGPWPGQQRAWNSQPYPQAPAQQAYPQPGAVRPQAATVPYPPASATPPRGRTPLLGLLGGAAFVLIAGFFVIALFNYLNQGTPSTTPSTEPTYGTNVQVPAPDPKPPALPSPKTWDQATTWMQQNVIYSQSVPVPTACQLKRVNVSTASTSELEAHLNELTACLWTVWNPPMTSAGFVVPRPTVTVFTKPITTACGNDDDLRNAFYCAGDQQIYYGQPVYEILPKDLWDQPFVAEAILAHEFGHLIQARSGIMAAEYAWETRDDTSKAKAMEYSRRTEVQADCMGGLFLHAVTQASGITQTDVGHMQEMTYSIAGDVQSGNPNQTDDHGRGKTRLSWWNQGYGSASVAVCNTFTASSDQVK